MPSEIDFTSPRFSELAFKLPANLTIFGRDLTAFRAWAIQYGMTGAQHVADIDRYVANDHDMVAHEYESPLSLSEIGAANSRIRTLMEKAERLVLIVNVVDFCTPTEIRHSLAHELPEFVSRIVYRSGTYKSVGVKAVLIERRRPRIFLFLTDMSKAGKTETAIWLDRSSDIAVVHGDELFFGILAGKIAAPAELVSRIRSVNAAPFDRSLFAQFVALMPKFDGQHDVALDFRLPTRVHFKVVEFFEEQGYFPILCLTGADIELYTNHHENEVQIYKQRLEAKEVEARRYEVEARLYKEKLDAEANLHVQQFDAYKNAILRSTSWRVTAPLRFVRHLAQMQRTFAGQSDGIATKKSHL